jgi:hypothetical protein
VVSSRDTEEQEEELEERRGGVREKGKERKVLVKAREEPMRAWVL